MRKNFTRILAAVAASFAVLSCMQANLEEEPVNILPNQYIATFESSDDEGSPDTKVSLASDNTTVTWDKGDVIEFINDNAQYVSTWQAGTVDQNGKRAVFDLKSGSAEKQATFAIYRGLNEGTSIGLVNGRPTMISFIMQKQTGLFKDANVMAAKIVDRTLEFKQVFGIFELKVSDSKVKKILVEGPGIASAVEVTFYQNSNSKNIDNVKPVGQGYDAITVDNIKPGTWYVAVAPKTYDAGSITISYLDANDAVVTSVKYPNLLTVYRKDIIAFGDISEHTTMSSTLPDGDTFRNYMIQLAGTLNNITGIQFYRSMSNPQGGIEIAKDVYMSYSNGIISVKTSKTQYTANEDCSGMFDGCKNATFINGLSNVNTSATTDMAWMFNDCYKLKSLDLGWYFTTANVTNMFDMFYSCEALEELDLGTWNTRKVTNMGYMFEWCWALKKVILGRNFVIPDGCFVDEMLLGGDVTFYGTTEEMESFNRSLVPGNTGDYYPGCLHFAIDMGDAGWWSAWNVGAEKPVDYGDYYAWGETKTKSDYSWHTYFDNPSTDGLNFTKYNNDGGKTVLDPVDDVAHVKWGGKWRMPTDDECTKLTTKCTWAWTDSYKSTGVAGRIVTSSNGNYIFLPAAGYREGGGGLGSARSYGCYWSSSLNTYYPYYAYEFGFGSDFVGTYSYHRRRGLSVRPVSDRPVSE